MLLWSAPLYALAAVLLPGSGLAPFSALPTCLLALACAYLVLLEPVPQQRRRSLPHRSPRLRQPTCRPWGLVRARRLPVGPWCAAHALADPRACACAPARQPPKHLRRARRREPAARRSSPGALPLILCCLRFFRHGAASLLLRAWCSGWRSARRCWRLLLGVGIWQVDFSRPLWLLPNGWGVDLAAPLTRYGYTWQLQQDNMPVVALSLLITGGALLLAAGSERNRTFPAVAWVLAGGYVALALLTAGPKAPVIAAPLALAMLAALGVFALQGGRRGKSCRPPALADPAAAGHPALPAGGLDHRPDAAQSPGRQPDADSRDAAGAGAAGVDDAFPAAQRAVSGSGADGTSVPALLLVVAAAPVGRAAPDGACSLPIPLSISRRTGRSG